MWNGRKRKRRSNGKTGDNTKDQRNIVGNNPQIGKTKRTLSIDQTMMESKGQRQWDGAPTTKYIEEAKGKARLMNLRTTREPSKTYHMNREAQDRKALIQSMPGTVRHH